MINYLLFSRRGKPVTLVVVRTSSPEWPTRLLGPPRPRPRLPCASELVRTGAVR